MAFFVRSINQAEQSQLAYLIETNLNNPAFLTQLRIIQLSSQRLKSGEISRQLKVSQGQVANCIKLFNRCGLSGLRETTRPALPPEGKRTYRHTRQLSKVVSINRADNTEDSDSTPSYYQKRQRMLYTNIAQIIASNNNAYPTEEKESSIQLSLETLQSAFQNWRVHPLDPHYLYVYLDETSLTIGNTKAKNTHIIKNNVSQLKFMLAMGVKLDGTKDFLSIGGGTEWCPFVTELAKRGLKRVNLWIMPVNEALAEAIQLNFSGQPMAYSKDSLQQILQMQLSAEAQATVKSLITEIYNQPVYIKAQLKVSELIEILARESALLGDWLTLRQDELLYFYQMPRYHWHFLKSTHPVKELCNLVSKWSRMLEAMETHEDWWLLFYCIFTSIPYRRLKV